MAEYRLFVQSMYDKACGFYETYGISAVNDGVPTRIIRDISLDREKVEALVRAFNREGLEPEHLSQAVEEFLYDFER